MTTDDNPSERYQVAVELAQRGGHVLLTGLRADLGSRSGPGDRYLPIPPVRAKVLEARRQWNRVDVLAEMDDGRKVWRSQWEAIDDQETQTE